MRRLDQKNKIIDFYIENKRMPVYGEIMGLLGFKSKNSVYKLIENLVKEGVVIKDSNGRISPAKAFGEIPLLGLIEAGIPADVEEQELDTVNLEDWLVDDKSNTYMLEVKGDSMVEAYINEGDYIIVERKGEARVGDIVIAEIDNGWTMKYFRKDKKGRVYLEPANAKYSSIYPKEDFKVAAIVKAVIRKY